jgi:hypothetical protein
MLFELLLCCRYCGGVVEGYVDGGRVRKSSQGVFKEILRMVDKYLNKLRESTINGPVLQATIGKSEQNRLTFEVYPFYAN